MIHQFPREKKPGRFTRLHAVHSPAVSRLHSNRRVVISGLGLVCPLGDSAWQTFTALLHGATITDRAAALSRPINCIDMIRALGCVRVAQHSATDPAVELAERAARQALIEAGAKPNGLAAILGASKGAVHAMTAALARRLPPQRRRRLIPAAVDPVLPRDAELAVALGPHGYLAHHLQRRLALGPVHNVVAACASSLTALHQARTALLREDGPQRILVVTAEASLLPVFIHSYRRLGVLPPLTGDAYRAAPLDHARCGFTLAEVAAAVVLEVTGQPQHGQIELLDTAAATEAYDMVRPAKTMTALTHVAKQIITGRTINVLHPHATGTADHDPVELEAYKPALNSTPSVYAVKGALGHGLGAAGLVALVIAALCNRARRLPPMPWLNGPIDAPAMCLNPGAAALPAGTTHAVFAAGFAGHVAGAVIRAVD